MIEENPDWNRCIDDNSLKLGRCVHACTVCVVLKELGSAKGVIKIPSKKRTHFVFERAPEFKLSFQNEKRISIWILAHTGPYYTQTPQWHYPNITITITIMILKVDPDVLSLNEKHLHNQKKIVVFLITSITSKN